MNFGPDGGHENRRPEIRLWYAPVSYTHLDGAEQHVAVEDRDDVFAKPGMAHAEVGAAEALAFVVHPADHGEAGMIVLLIGLHVHAEWIRVREEGAERFVELFIDGDEAAEILDAELDAVYLGQIVQILPDFFERDRHKTTPFYHLSEV